MIVENLNVFGHFFRGKAGAAGGDRDDGGPETAMAASGAPCLMAMVCTPAPLLDGRRRPSHSAQKVPELAGREEGRGRLGHHAAWCTTRSANLIRD